jgi:hypothetical protein
LNKDNRSPVCRRKESGFYIEALGLLVFYSWE